MNITDIIKIDDTITHLFDISSATQTEWVNQIDNSKNFQWTYPQIEKDYIRIDGGYRASSYGVGTAILDLPENEDERIYYFVYKGLNNGNAAIRMFENEGSTLYNYLRQNKASLHASNNSTTMLDSGIDTIRNWVSVAVAFESKHTVSLYVNGYKYGTYTNNTYADSSCYKLLLGKDTILNTTTSDTLFKFVMIGNKVPDEETIRQNCGKLYGYYKDTIDPEQYVYERYEYGSEYFSNNGSYKIQTGVMPIPHSEVETLYISSDTVGLANENFSWGIIFYKTETGGSSSDPFWCFTNDTTVDISSYVKDYKYFRIFVKSFNGASLKPGDILRCAVYFYAYYKWLMKPTGLTNIEAPALIGSAMERPFPKSVWRIKDGYNNGYPYNELMPDIPYIEPIKLKTYTSPCVYSVFANDTMIFSSDLPDKNYALINPTLELEVSHSGSLSFTIPPTHFYINNIDRFTTTFTVNKNGDYYWDGRILSMEYDFYNNCKITVEGALSYLNDTYQPQCSYNHKDFRQIADALMAIHNSKVDPLRMFEIGYIPQDYPDEEVWSTDYSSTMECFNKIAEAVNGFMRLEMIDGKRVFSIFKEDSLDTVSQQQIIFGSNLMDFTRSYDMSNMVTVLLPLGKKSTGSKSYVGDVQDHNEYHEGEVLVKDDNGIHWQQGLPGYFKAKGYTGLSTDKEYYITTRLPKGQNYILYVIWIMVNGNWQVWDYKETSSGLGYDTVTQVKVEIPEGFWKLEVCGECSSVDIVVNVANKTGEDQTSYITVDSVNNGDIYVKAVERDIEYTFSDGTSASIHIDPLAQWGWIEKAVTFDDIENPQKLYDKAVEYLTNYQFDSMSIDISAMDLINLGVTTNSLEIYQKVRVISPPHGLDRLFPIDKMSIVLNDPTSNTYSLNSKDEYSLANANNDIDSTLMSILETVPETGAVLEAARRNALYLLENGTEGIVTLNKDPATGNVNSITIACEQDWKAPLVPHWIWDYGGLGFITYDQYGNKTVANALTNDGAIVANRITTGTMFANHIKGGDLILGAYDDGTKDGLIRVRRENGSTAFEATKYGCYVNGEIMTERGNNWMHIINAGIIFGDYENGEKVERSYFDGEAHYIKGGKELRGLHQKADIIEFDCDVIGVEKSKDSDVYYTGYDGDIEVVTSVNYNSDGKVTGVNKRTLSFVHGILVN